MMTQLVQPALTTLSGDGVTFDGVVSGALASTAESPETGVAGLEPASTAGGIAATWGTPSVPGTLAFTNS